MIVFKTLLPRDLNTRHHTFGFYDTYYIRCSLGTPLCPQFGLALEMDDAKFPPPIVKLVEQYNVGPRIGYIERLCYNDKGYLYPYRMKYITPGKQWDTQLIIPRNVEEIHRILDGKSHMDLMTPASLYVQHIKPSNIAINTNPLKKSIYDRYGVGYSLMTNFCNDDLRWYDIYNDIKRNSAFDSNFRNDRIDHYTEAYIEELLLPKIPFADPLSIKALDEPIHVRELGKHFGPTCGVSFAQPKELDIKYPELTDLSPKEQKTTVDFINDIGYSDLILEYILSNKSVVKRDVVFAWDRYYQGLDEAKELSICDRAVVNCLYSCLDVSKREVVELSSDVKVVFKKTFNDEAIFEIYTLDDKPIKVVHLDLAVLSLCSMGVISFNII